MSLDIKGLYIMMAADASFYWVQFPYDELHNEYPFDKIVHHGKLVFYNVFFNQR